MKILYLYGISNFNIVDLRKNVERGMTKKLQDGGVVQMAPLGYKNDKNTKSVYVDTEKKDYIKKIFKLRIESKGYKEISDILYKEGFKSKSGKPFGHSTIENIIKNKFYIGIMNFGGKSYTGNYETFISSKLYNMANNAKTFSTRSYPDGFFSLKGIICSQYDKKPLLASYSKERIYYRRHGAGVPDEENINISEELIVKEFGKNIHMYSLNKNLLEPALKGCHEYYVDLNNENIKQKDILKSKLDTIGEKRKQLLELVLANTISSETYKEKENEYMISKKEIEEQLTNFFIANDYILDEAQKTIQLLCNVGLVWKKANYSEKIEIIKLIAIQLFIDHKKTLIIEENPLFKVMRNVNFQSGFAKW